MPVPVKKGESSQQPSVLSAHDRLSSTPFPETATHSSRSPVPVLVCLPVLVGSWERLCNTPVCRPDAPRPDPRLEEYGDGGRHGVERTSIPAQDPSHIFHS